MSFPVIRPTLGIVSLFSEKSWDVVVHSLQEAIRSVSESFLPAAAS